ncbi:hypothetical protein BJ165DRAFT_1385840 [Panaeolus papilionaceus]|nr:hypothetical protein BJ165DRAFT_1385840 [Panaeolus papilionaceus]
MGPVTLNVFFHVISEDATRQGGNIPDTMIQQQVAVLNNDYRATGVSFRIVGVDRTVNSAWYRRVYHGNAETVQMTNALRRGGPADLNIYTVGFKELPPNTPSLLGYATFPWYYASQPQVDGVFIIPESLPSGTASPYNLGKTATHEVGHWVGLYHTFQGGCSSPGDYVDDTPFEASAAFGCQSGRDTCSQPGVDPIHNFMDYSDDACLTEFSFGQSKRLRLAMNQFRSVPM